MQGLTHFWQTRGAGLQNFAEPLRACKNSMTSAHTQMGFNIVLVEVFLGFVPRCSVLAQGQTEGSRPNGDLKKNQSTSVG